MCATAHKAGFGAQGIRANHAGGGSVVQRTYNRAAAGNNRIARRHMARKQTLTRAMRFEPTMALVKRSGGAPADLKRFREKRANEKHLPIVGESLVAQSTATQNLDTATQPPQFSRAERMVMDEKPRAEAPAPPPSAWARALAWLHREW